MTDHASKLSVCPVPLLTRLCWVTCVAALMTTSAANAQTPLIPSGAGTQGDPYQISQLGHLVWMGVSAAPSTGRYYMVQNDMDATGTAGWNSGAGFAPIGSGATNFLGTFNGNGKTIANLTINRPTQDSVGLFGHVGGGGMVKGLGLVGCSVTGTNLVGGLAGRNYGTVSECHVSGSVTGYSEVGALVGDNGGTVNGCHATGSVTGTSGFIGGLIGWNNAGVANSSYASSAVTGNSYVGGLIGYNGSGEATRCFATGPVAGSSYVGGLLGGSVGTINECYAVGLVTGGGPYVGGLAGIHSGTVNSSYWDTNTTGQASSGAGTGATTEQMKQQATFGGWDFSIVWTITENVTYPSFRTSPWSGAVDLGGGWRWLSWFGFFNDGASPWIYHNEHGWMYTPSTSPSSIWFYTSDLGWLWTSSTVYPSLYRSSTGQWLWYQKDSDNPRWFYNFNTAGWESH